MMNNVIYPGASAISREPRIHAGPLTPDQTERFEALIAGFRPVFHRADQFLRFRVYIRGLLESTERKNVESIAAAAATTMMVETNLPQALQHFVSNSPWDHRRLMARVRALTRPDREDPEAVWVLHDAVFVKKGRHSVGVHRQYARSLGRKANCQIGVILAQFGPRGYFPLATRLYLPNAWLRENEATATRHIPEAERIAQSRPQIAISLINEAHEDGEIPRPIVGEPGYSTTDLTDDLTKKDLVVVAEPGAHLTAALERFEWLKEDFGLDHYEGRNWQGWHHHVVLVFTAYHLTAALISGR